MATILSRPQYVKNNVNFLLDNWVWLFVSRNCAQRIVLCAAFNCYVMSTTPKRNINTVCTFSNIWINDEIHLTHWGQVTHICVSKLTIIGSVIGLSPGWHQGITWTNSGILFIWTIGSKVGEWLSTHFHSRKRFLKCRPQFCLGLNVLKWEWSNESSRNYRHMRVSGVSISL